MTQQPFPGQPQQGWPQQAPQQGYPAQQPQYGQPAADPWPTGPSQPAQNPWAGQQPQAQAPAAPAPAVQTGDEFDDFFSGGGEKIPGFDFGATQNGGEKQVGSMIVGTITEMAKMAQRDYSDKNKVLYWEPRDESEVRRPRMQLAITLQTDLRNWQGVKPKLIPTDPVTNQQLTPDHDTGLRRVYVKEYSDMNRAINIACQQAGQKPRKGGKLALIVRGFEPTDRGNDKVLYEARYQPAPEVAPTDAFFAQPAPAAPAPQGFGGPVPGFQGQPDQQGQFPPAQVAQQPLAAPQHAVQQQGGVLPQGQGQVANQTGQPEPVAAPPQQFPSTLGNNPAPAAPPAWAGPTGQEGYAPAPEQQAAPQQPAAPIPSSQYTEPQF